MFIVLAVLIIIVVFVIWYYRSKESAVGGYSYGGAYSGPSSVGGSSHSGGSHSGGSHGIHSGHGYNMPISSAGAYSGHGYFGLYDFPFSSWLLRSRLGRYYDDDYDYIAVPRQRLPICEDVGGVKPCVLLEEQDAVLL
jgi:hypothetical protein